MKPRVFVVDDQALVRRGVVALLSALRARGCKVPVLLLSTFDDSQALVDGLRAGAQGLLLKTIEPEPLLQAIAAAARGESLFAHLASDQLLHALARANAARDGLQSRPDRGRLTIELTSREQRCWT